MPREPQIDLIELAQLLDQTGPGKMNQKEIADYFGVSEGAVSRAKRKLKKGIVGNTTRTQMQRFIGKKVDAVQQLQNINATANALLDLYMGWIAGDKGSLDKLREQIKQSKLNEEAAAAEAALFVKTKDPHELALKVMAEIRNQLSLQLEISKTLYDIKTVQEFQEEVLGVIGKVDPHARAAIIEGLNKRRALLGAVKFK